MSDIYQALSAVMESVQAVKKGERNNHGGYNFRGIDAVVNAVGPELRKHKVIVTPEVETYEFGEIETGKNRTPMGHARVVVRYTFHALDGSAITCSAAGEAFDSGDKATPKAMSVAFRTALLQALCLPTDEPDPDSQTYERAPRQAVRQQTGNSPDPVASARQQALAKARETYGDNAVEFLEGALSDLGATPQTATVEQWQQVTP